MTETFFQLDVSLTRMLEVITITATDNNKKIFPTKYESYNTLGVDLITANGVDTSIHL